MIYLLFIIFYYKDLSKAKSVICKRTEKILIEKIHKDVPTQIDGSFFGEHKKIMIGSSDITINIITN